MRMELAAMALEHLGVQHTRSRRRRIAFGYYGGKYSHLRWLLPLLPKTRAYCEPFGGSAAVLLNREPSLVETYNDLDGDVVNFFRVLREHTEELVSAIALTPVARAELILAAESKDDPSLDPVERARMFYVRAMQTRFSLAQTASEGRWLVHRAKSHRGMSQAVSAWIGHLAVLGEVAVRLLRVQIENRPALKVIRQYDSPDTLFYCDPPYPLQSRSGGRAYRYEMSDADHEELAAVLHNVQGKVAVSGYRCKLMDRLYGDWQRIDAPPKVAPSARALRQESLWVNYEVALPSNPQTPGDE